MRENSFSFQSNNLTSNVIMWITFTNNNREFIHNPTKIIHNIYYQILYFAHQIFIVNIVHHKYQEGLFTIKHKIILIFKILFFQQIPCLLTIQIIFILNIIFPTNSMFTHTKPSMFTHTEPIILNTVHHKPSMFTHTEPSMFTHDPNNI